MNKLDYALWMIEQLAEAMLENPPDKHTLHRVIDLAAAIRNTEPTQSE